MPSQTGATEFMAVSRSAPRVEHGKQDADAKVKAVEHDIGEDGEGEDESPDRSQIKVFHDHSPPLAAPSVRSGSTAVAGVMPAVRIGASSSSGPGSPAIGGWAISLSMYQMPTEKTEK